MDRRHARRPRGDGKVLDVWRVGRGGVEDVVEVGGGEVVVRWGVAQLEQAVAEEGKGLEERG
jgi:hypothetical protein